MAAFRPSWAGIARSLIFNRQIVADRAVCSLFFRGFAFTRGIKAGDNKLRINSFWHTRGLRTNHMPLGDINRIGTNVGSLIALNALGDVNRQLQVSRARLATGKRITEASDDPAGYSVANTLTRTARGLGTALNGIQTFENFLSVAEGGIRNIQDILFSIRDLFVQAASDTVGATERTAMANQLAALKAEIDRIAAKTTFNGTALLDGSFSSTQPAPLAMSIHVGSRPARAEGTTSPSA